MKATGIVRRIDDLGRVVIPKEIRRTMRIREGDPLEIYTAKDGEVIFKKYSPMGELSDYSAHLCETMNKTTGAITAITDRDSVISACGIPRKELNDRRVSPELEQIMESRQPYRRRMGDRALPLADNAEKYSISVAAPIIANGDILGCVTFLSADGAQNAGEVEVKLAQAAAGFLSRQMSQ